MKIFTQMTDLSHQFSNIAVALGTFDGVHIGHQKIITRVVDLARFGNGTSVVFTFSNHPLAALAPERCPIQITTLEDKAALLEAMGVDVLLTIPFTPQFLQLSPQEFITILLENFQPKNVVVGPNYSFGYKGAGTPEMLKEAGLQYDFNVEIHEAVYKDNILVSSTTIRKIIADGNIIQAEALLGRKIQVTGRVISGDGRGRTLGYPTANLSVDPGLLIPGDGVYVVRLDLNGTLYYGLANIGDNPTFLEQERRIEVYVLGFDGNLYGQTLSVAFLERIRGEVAFATVDELTSQIALDLQSVNKYYFLNR